jgi:nicotinate-nucleotide adenylyltransferase
MTDLDDRPEIALLGGSFNPPHAAHVMAAWWALATQGVREAWLLPTWRHAFGKALAPWEDRVRMCELAVVQLRGAHVCTAEEALRDDPLCGRTARTLEYLVERHPDRRFALLIGADLLPETPRWYRWDRVQQLARVVVVGRQGYEGGEGPALPAISSTAIRERLARGETVDGLVPARVLAHLRARGLYGATAGEP